MHERSVMVSRTPLGLGQNSSAIDPPPIVGTWDGDARHPVTVHTPPVGLQLALRRKLVAQRRRNDAAHTRRLVAQLEHLGHTVIINPAA